MRRASTAISTSAHNMPRMRCSAALSNVGGSATEKKCASKRAWVRSRQSRLASSRQRLIILIAALAVFAVIPFGSMIPPEIFGIQLSEGEAIPLVVAPGADAGLIYVFALSSIAVYGVILGGWASNNKYSFLGDCGRALS